MRGGHIHDVCISSFLYYCIYFSPPSTSDLHLFGKPISSSGVYDGYVWLPYLVVVRHITHIQHIRNIIIYVYKFLYNSFCWCSSQRSILIIIQYCTGMCPYYPLQSTVYSIGNFLPASPYWYWYWSTMGGCGPWRNDDTRGVSSVSTSIQYTTWYIHHTYNIHTAP